MKKISIKNIIKGVAITFIFGAIILYFIMPVPITIMFIQGAPDKVVQDMSKKMNGELVRRIRSEDGEINSLIMYIPHWKRIVYKKDLEKNPYIKEVYNMEAIGFDTVDDSIGF